MSWNRRRTLPLLVLGAGALGATLIVVSSPSERREAPQPAVPVVRFVSAETGDIRFRVRTHGTVKPRTESELVPEVSGPVTWISPALVSGGFFNEGEPLLRVDPHDYEVALERARATLARRESELRLADRERQRQRSLNESEVASISRLDDAETAARVAEAGLREARAALAQAERDLARTEIRAPYTGRVREERVDLGQFVNRGTPVARIYAVDIAEVRLPVADAELAYLDLPLGRSSASMNGEAPEVTLRADFAGEAHQWSGRVVRTEGEIDPRSRMVHVVAQVDDPYGPEGGEPADPPLAVGLFVEAEIFGRTAKDVIALPRAALRGSDRILVIDADDRLRFRNVKVLRAGREEVIVRSGLAHGERVCISPLETAVEGMKVRAVEAGT